MQNNKRLLELDALRGIAAVLVVVFHFTLFFGSKYFKFTKFGITGVELFFIISGFVIFMSITNLQNSKEFIANRLARLFPTYWACVSFTFLMKCIVSIFIVNSSITKADFILYIGNMTMFQYYLKIENLDGPYWTLIIEMLFYITIYLLYISKQLQRIEFFGLLAVILICILQYPNIPLLNNAYKSIDLYFPLFSYLSLFLAGIVFYKIYHEKATFFRYTIIIACYVAEIMKYKNRNFLGCLTFNEYAGAILIYFLFFVLFVKNKLHFLATKPVIYLGTISYALYLVHQYFSVSFLIPLLNEKLKLSLTITYLITFVSVLVLASIITFFIEIPFRKKLRKQLRLFLKVNN